MINYSTEYLIINEDNVNWDALSSMKDDSFSFVEIRLFRSKINWKLYFESHIRSCPFTTQMLEIASKYFDKSIYNLLANFNIPEEDFILNHLDDFDFEMLIKNCSLSEDFLVKTLNYWADIPNIKDVFLKSKYINIERPDYAQVKLIFEVS